LVFSQLTGVQFTIALNFIIGKTMPQITSYELVGTPVDNVNNNIKFPTSIFPRSYNSIIFHDSIFSFYPLLEIDLKDEVGITIDKTFFVEGLEWNFKFGSNEQNIKRKGKSEVIGYINHNYVWSQTFFSPTTISTNFSGNNNLILISAYLMKDDYRARITWNAKISDVVTTVLNDYGVIDSKKKFITATTGSSYWPQYSILNKDFLTKLSNVAYQSNKSPFFTFFNCNGEFYFMSLNDLFKQDPIGTYSLKYNETSVIDDWAIQSYKIVDQGLPHNRENYKNTGVRLNDDGTITSTPYLLKDQYLKQNSSKDKMLVRTKYTSGKNRSVNLGIVESTEMDTYNAKVNSLFTNSNISYQMEIVVRYNPQAISGKVINIEVNNFDNKTKMQEFTGSWLICDSQHLCDDNGIPSTKMLVAKSSINVKKENPFYGEYI
jgi:hypothetical protein